MLFYCYYSSSPEGGSNVLVKKKFKSQRKTKPKLFWQKDYIDLLSLKREVRAHSTRALTCLLNNVTNLSSKTIYLVVHDLWTWTCDCFPVCIFCNIYPSHLYNPVTYLLTIHHPHSWAPLLTCVCPQSPQSLWCCPVSSSRSGTC